MSWSIMKYQRENPYDAVFKEGIPDNIYGRELRVGVLRRDESCIITGSNVRTWKSANNRRHGTLGRMINNNKGFWGAEN